MPMARQVGTTVHAKATASLGKHGRTIISFALLLLCWEGLVRLLGIKLYILPPPSYVLSTLWTKWAIIGAAAWQTAQPMLIGYGFAVAIGVAIALMFAISKLLESIVYPQIVFLQIIPKIAIAPLPAQRWPGREDRARVALALIALTGWALPLLMVLAIGSALTAGSA